jgi:hypothetical protein
MTFFSTGEDLLKRMIAVVMLGMLAWVTSLQVLAEDPGSQAARGAGLH